MRIVGAILIPTVNQIKHLLVKRAALLVVYNAANTHSGKIICGVYLTFEVLVALAFFYASIHILVQNVVAHCFGFLVIFQFKKADITAAPFLFFVGVKSTAGQHL